MTILLVGACGSGKTFVMKKLLTKLDTQKAKFHLFRFALDEHKNIAIMGVYDGSTFEGSDRLSMAVMKDVHKLRNLQLSKKMSIVCEGDRFMNKTFIDAFQPFIVKILDTGELGRQKRNTTQSSRQIQSIQTRVNNIQAHCVVQNSTEALLVIEKKLFYEKN